MKMTTSWAFASSAVVAILIAGCTTEVSDNSEGGASTTGTAGSTSGTAGSAGSTGTSGSSGAGGSSSDTDASTPPGPCEACAYSKCAAEADKCEKDEVANGCHAHVDDFYDCLGTAETATKVEACGTDFASNVVGTGMSQIFANDLAGCVTDTDPTKGCLAECMGGASGDAGKD
jgi:hypothetical protein